MESSPGLLTTTLIATSYKKLLIDGFIVCNRDWYVTQMS
jgi:hypothetical protein